MCFAVKTTRFLVQRNTIKNVLHKKQKARICGKVYLYLIESEKKMKYILETGQAQMKDCVN